MIKTVIKSDVSHGNEVWDMVQTIRFYYAFETVSLVLGPAGFSGLAQ